MTLTAMLLAGGQSRRMGRDKATLDFEGEPLWQRQLRVLRELQPDRLVLSARSEPQWKPAELDLILDEPPSRGPLSGLVAGFAALETSHLLALAVDMPRMTGRALQELCASIEPGVGAVPVIDGRAEPLAAVYPVEAFGAFAAALVGRDWSLQPIVLRLADSGLIRLVEIAGAATEAYRNFNSPADLVPEAWRARGLRQSRAVVVPEARSDPAIAEPQ